MPLDREELVRRLTVTFLEEVGEHVRVFNRELLSLEREPELRRAEAIQSLFRAAHSLKGAARSVNATAIAVLSHKLEELLLRVRDGKRALTPDLFAVLFRVSDALVESGERFRTGISDDPVLLQLTERIEAALEEPSQRGSEDPAGRASSIPNGPPSLPSSFPAFPAFPAAEPATRVSGPSGRKPALSEPVPDTTVTTDTTDTTDTTRGAVEGDPGPSTGRSARSAPSLIPLGHPRGEEVARGGVANGGALAADEQGVIRVPKRRLDRLVAESGELRSARLRLDARRTELELLDELVQRWRTEWSAAKTAFNRQSRRQGKKGFRDARRATTDVSSNGVSSNGAGSNGGTHPEELPRRALRLLERTGEYLQRLERDLGRLTTAFKADQREIVRAAEPLETHVLGLRMEPFGEIADGLSRIARDLAFSESKLVDLVIEGAEIEIDRSLLEALKAPLSHLLRNAIDHGIEEPAERRRRGKHERGKVVISTRLRGDAVEIELSDDGRGLDLAAIRSRAEAGGIDVAAADDVSRLIFVHGLSTAERVTEISGRGVGLDVVKTELEGFGGRVDVSSEPGRGTRFLLELPPSLSAARVLFVRAAGETFALPCAGIERLVRVEAKSLTLLDGKPVALLGELPLPVITLARVLGLPAPALSADARIALVVLSVRGRRIGLGVDEAIDHREVLLKPFGRRFRRFRHISSATILPNGRLSLVLNPAELVATALELPETLGVFAAPSSVEARRRLLLVDDSMTTRTLERNILESAGYEVLAAPDGQAALELLERHGADLVVSDVEMPNLDGLGLVSAIRASARFRDLPVILLTSLEAADHRQKGLDAGADAYLVKSAFDQSRLLETIRQLL